MFRNNKLQRNECALVLQLLSIYHCNFDRLLISLEYNTYGELFLYSMDTYMESNQEIAERFDESCLVKYYNESGRRYTRGIKVTPGNKSTHCLLFKEEYERNISNNNCAQFMVELEKFCDDGTGHYKASFGHDDMVMAQIQLEFVKKTLQYKIMRGNFDEGIMSMNDNMYNPFEYPPNFLNSEGMMNDYYNRLNRLNIN